ncbi:MAG: lipocalin family protein [Cloacibacterium sp.]|nr:lipocalin family protein [Cloacibacterium sp.]
MKIFKIIRKMVPLLAITLLLFSCKRDGAGSEGEIITDPFVGNWKLRIITVNGQSTEVTNIACWKDTTMNVTANSAVFKLVFPNQQTGNCQNEQYTYTWVKKNDGYYFTENGQESLAPIKLLDNNQTLQLNLQTTQGAIIFSFRK